MFPWKSGLKSFAECWPSLLWCPITLLGPKQCQLIAHVDHFCCCPSPRLLSLLWLALPADGSPLDLDNWLHLYCTHSLWPQRLCSWVIQLTALSRSCLKYLHNADNTGGASRLQFTGSSRRSLIISKKEQRETQWTSIMNAK